MQLDRFRTPQVLVDRPRLERNLGRMRALTAAGGVALRPHAKTHKVIPLARRQLELGAVGICCAKLGEAEVFAAHGVTDIRVPYPVQPINADRVVALLDRCRLSIIVDDLEVARAWSAAMRAAGRALDVLVKVDVGFHRCGIDPRAPGAVDLVTRVASLPALRFRGLLSHAGQAYHATSEEALRAIAAEERALLGELAAALRARGVEVTELSVGATPTARFSAGLEGLTELRPGNYVYFDRTQVGLGAATLDDCALTVLATVVSAPAPDRIVLDCGSKTLSNDVARGFGETRGHGIVLRPDQGTQQADDAFVIERLSEEHAVVRVMEGPRRLRPGDRLRVVPNHACVVSNLVDEVLVVDNGEVVDVWPVAARGRIR